jgi:hypothetical protein
VILGHRYGLGLCIRLLRRSSAWQTRSILSAQLRFGCELLRTACCHRINFFLQHGITWILSDGQKVILTYSEVQPEQEAPANEKTNDQNIEKLWKLRHGDALPPLALNRVNRRKFRYGGWPRQAVSAGTISSKPRQRDKCSNVWLGLPRNSRLVPLSEQAF